MNAPTDDERIRQHADLVYRTCLRLTGNAQDAADVTQEVFVAWLRQHREITGSVAGWLYGTARQRSLDWLRTNHRRERHERAAAEQPVEVVTEADWHQHLDSALEELPTSVRTLVVEHHLLGLTQGQLATRHRCTQATISRRLTQALELLRSALQSRGVSASGAVLFAGFTSARASACPASLVAPVLAQTHLIGAPALMGSAVLAPGIVTLITLSVISVLIVALLATFTWNYIWRAEIVRHLDRDWTTLLLAEPAAAPTLSAPLSGHRYASIEALIARLPAMDADLQQRAAELIDHLPNPSWGAANTPEEVQAMWQQFTHRRVLTAERVKYASIVLSQLAPVLRAKGAIPLMLGEATRISAAYASGQLASSDLRRAWHARSVSRADVAMDVTKALVEGKINSPHRLDDLDAWVWAHDRGCAEQSTAMIVLDMHAERDLAYLNLIRSDQLDPQRTQSWLAESSPMQSLAERGILGGMLLHGIPWMEDLRGAHASWTQPLTARDDLLKADGLATFLPRLIGLHAALSGQPGDLNVMHANDDLVLKQTRSGVYFCLQLASWSSSLHRAKRIAARLAIALRSGTLLPEQLAQNELAAVADWHLRYERLSAERFRIVIDPDAGVPPYTDAAVASWLRNQGHATKRRLSGPMAVVPQVGLEMSLTPGDLLITPISQPAPADEEEEPILPSIPQ